MSSDEGMKPKSPWKRGGQDAELGDKKSEFAASVLETLENKSIERFRTKLIEVGGTYSETFPVLPSGDIQVRDEDPDGPDILMCSPAKREKTQEGDVSVTRIRYRPDDVRIGAKRITEKYPDITFEFGESQTRDKITYTATFKNNEGSE